MRIDFDRMEIFTDIAHTQCSVVSIRKDFADLIYKQGSGLDALSLALKIHGGDGTEDYTDAECALIRRTSEQCTPAVIEAVRTAMEKGGER